MMSQISFLIISILIFTTQAFSQKVIKKDTTIAKNDQFEFVEFSETKSADSEMSIVNRHLTEIISMIDNNKDKYFELDNQKRNDIERNWKEFKNTKNRNWLELLSKKREEFLEIYLKYLDSEQDIQELESKAEINRQERNVVEKSLALFRSQSVYADTLKSQLKDDFISQMANISVSKTIYAVIPQGEEDGFPQKKDQLQEAVSRFAVDRILGYDIQSYQEVKNNNLIVKSIQQSKSGNARINESYADTYIEGRNRFIVLLIRCEVSPFQQNRRTDVVRGDSISDSFEYMGKIYFITRDKMHEKLKRYRYSEKQRRFVVDSNSSLNIVEKFSKKFNEYQSETALTNNSIEQYIKDIKDKYQSQEKEIDRKIKSYEVEVKKALDKLSQLHDLRDALTKQLSDKKRINMTIRQELDSLEKSYKLHYENRIEYLEKYSELPEEGMSQKEAQKELVKKLYQELNADLRNIRVSTTVINTTTERSASIKTESKTVSYGPSLSAFMILYKYFDKRENQVLQIANIAFKVKWLSYIETRLEIIGDSIKDNESKLIWWRKIRGDESIEDILTQIPNGFRLPTENELSNLWNLAVGYATSHDMGLFEKMNWEYLEYPFLTSEYESKTKLYLVKSLKGNEKDYYDNSRSAYSVFVKTQ